MVRKIVMGGRVHGTDCNKILPEFIQCRASQYPLPQYLQCCSRVDHGVLIRRPTRGGVQVPSR